MKYYDYKKNPALITGDIIKTDDIDTNFMAEDAIPFAFYLMDGTINKKSIIQSVKDRDNWIEPQLNTYPPKRGYNFFIVEFSGTHEGIYHEVCVVDTVRAEI